MKKLYLILFFTSCLISLTSFVNAWESNLKTGCINENLEPCSSSEILSSESTENPELDSDKVVVKKKEISPSESTENPELDSDKVVVNENEVVKKKIKKKNIFKRFSSNKSKKNTGFDKNNSFEDFKTMLINYTDNSDYPNINN